MIKRLITVSSLVLRYLQLTQLFKNPTNKSTASEATMLKEIFFDAAASIELKMNKLYFKLALGIVAISILSYGIIRLIWYFENYLLLNYGQSYALFLVGILAAVAISPLLYLYLQAKYTEKEKENQKLERARIEALEAQKNPSFLAAPEKIIHQAVIGFIDGLRNPSRRTFSLQAPAGQSIPDPKRNEDFVFRQNIEALNLDRLRSAGR